MQAKIVEIDSDKVYWEEFESLPQENYVITLLYHQKHDTTNYNPLDKPIHLQVKCVQHIQRSSPTYTDIVIHCKRLEPFEWVNDVNVQQEPAI